MPLALLLLLPAACGDETISGFADSQALYHLHSIDKAAFPAEATIAFPKRGTVAGAGPCNRFSAAQAAPYPWFAPGPILATRRACPELSHEARFFDALSQMTLAEVSGPNLILSNDDGREMVFLAR